VGAALTYRNETKGGLENDPRLAIDSYTLLDLRAGLESETGSWRVMAWGRNVTDEYYWNNVLKAQDNVIRYAGRPVTYGVTFSYRF
jgi:iron complex outermembrane recepter protein